MEYKHSPSPEDYEKAVEFMRTRARAIREQSADELLWLLEHPPLYTAGSSAKPTDLIDAGRFPVFETGRGGQYTYHGPGQRVGYVLLDLKKRSDKPDIRAFVKQLEHWLINTLAHFGVTGRIEEGRVGVWVSTPQGEKKIAALGIRLQQWVTTHGVALNVHPDLSHYAGIVPCGLAQYGVTSLHDLGINVSMDEVDSVLKQKFQKQFGE
jgi:lipoyl(octanoyl) transferase